MMRTSMILGILLSAVIPYAVAGNFSHCRTPGSPRVTNHLEGNNVMQPNFVVNTSKLNTDISSLDSNQQNINKYVIKNEQYFYLPNHHKATNIDHSTEKCTCINHQLNLLHKQSSTSKICFLISNQTTQANITHFGSIFLPSLCSKNNITCSKRGKNMAGKP